MMRIWLLLAAFCGLSACVSPMSDLPTLAEQDIPEGSGSAGVAAAPEETGVGGLFGLLASTPGTPSESAGTQDAGTPRPSHDIVTSDVAPGITLPYGEVARVCGLKVRDMGKKIDQYPERRPQHLIYDSDPGSTGPHSFYVTGFGDGCARQFTASMAMFGPVALHEQLRYGLPAEVQPYSDTDKVYERLKSRLCGVPRRKPCGSRISRLERDTVFVSVYERFGSNPSWKNLLLHDGAVIAVDLKGG